MTLLESLKLRMDMLKPPGQQAIPLPPYIIELCKIIDGQLSRKEDRQ